MNVTSRIMGEWVIENHAYACRCRDHKVCGWCSSCLFRTFATRLSQVVVALVPVSSVESAAILSQNYQYEGLRVTSRLRAV